MHGLQAPWSQVTSARGLAETGSREGGEAAENYPDLLNHEWHHSRGTSARSADCVHNPGYTVLPRKSYVQRRLERGPFSEWTTVRPLVTINATPSVATKILKVILQIRSLEAHCQA